MASETEKKLAEELGFSVGAGGLVGGSSSPTPAEAKQLWAALVAERKRVDTIRNETLQTLASAMKKVLPPDLLQEVIDHCDPLAAFLRDGFGVESRQREGSQG